MFGGKLRTWMEAHIVRAKRKGQRQAKEPQGAAAPGAQEHLLRCQLQQQQASPSSLSAPAPPSHKHAHTAGNCKHVC